MGYFANLYLVDMSATVDAVMTSTEIFGAETKPYFSWGVGDRPTGVHSYAHGTVVTDIPLERLPGYPLVERCDAAWGADPNRCRIEASFEPRDTHDPVLFHFMLPTAFVPRPDLKPFEQPKEPFVFLFKDRIVATYPVVGSATIRFWIARLKSGSTLEDYDPDRLFRIEPQKTAEAEIEFNAGFVKFKKRF